MFDFQCTGCGEKMTDEDPRSYKLSEWQDGPPFLECKNGMCDFVYHVVKTKVGQIRVDPKSGHSLPERERGKVKSYF